MKTVYGHLVQQTQCAMVGQCVVAWCRTPMIRVTMNRLKKPVWEWVGSGEQITPEALASWRKQYPLFIHLGSMK